MIAVIGAQFGDEGKGKIVDYLFRSRPDHTTVRFNGGANAGHTTVIDGKAYKTHIIPATAYSDASRQIRCAIASGMVVDPIQLAMEIGQAKRHNAGLEVFIDWKTGVVTKQHLAEDAYSERKLGEKKIGTTKKGNGPAYADRAKRKILLIEDIVRGPDHIYDVLMQTEIFSRFDKFIRLSMAMELSLAGTMLEKNAKICDIGELAHDDDAVIFEGAHGTMLDILHGTYPYVTSSGCTAANIGCSVGMDPRKVKTVIGVAKAYSTRIGAGAFPTEIRPEPIANTMREAGKEYGTTTGRPRRIGWLDLPMLKYSTRLNGFDYLALTLTDVYAKAGVTEIPVCYAYEHNDKILDYPNARIYREEGVGITGKYDYFNAWEDPVDPLNPPVELVKFIEYIEEYLKCPIAIVSYGREAQQTWLRHKI